MEWQQVLAKAETFIDVVILYLVSSAIEILFSCIIIKNIEMQDVK